MSDSTRSNGDEVAVEMADNGISLANGGNLCQ